jgi:predicted MFS family arabinose efflux permease
MMTITDGSREQISWRWAAFAGWCAFLVGIGLARFAYAPLFPALVAAGWVSPAEAGHIGAANLIGYLAGALLAGQRRASVRPDLILRVMMLAATASFFAAALPLSFLWLFVWRFVSGLSGAVLLVIGAPAVLAIAPPARLGVVGGIMFGGIGIGIVTSGTVVPALMRAGPSVTWLGLGGAALVLTLAAWKAWPRQIPDRVSHPAADPGGGSLAPVPPTRWRAGLLPLYLAYALCAVACGPHTVFIVDFITRKLHRGPAVANAYWLLLGLGAMAGPMLLGRIGDHFGFGLSLRLALLWQAGSVAVVAVDTTPSLLAAVTFLAGAFIAGMPVLVLGRLRELVPHDARAQKSAWSIATLGFASGQASRRLRARRLVRQDWQ